MSRSSTRSARPRRSCCVARSAATSTAPCSPPSGNPPDAGAAARRGPRSPAAASPFRWAGASSRAQASSPGFRWPSACPSCARSKPKAWTGVELKWPNDLVYRHLKVGGILVELNGDALGPSTVVVGVGLNVRLPVEVRRDIDQPVSDLTTVAGRGAPAIDRNHLLARVAADLAGDARCLRQRRFPALCGRVAAAPCLPGQAGQVAAARWRQRQGQRSPASTAPARWCLPTARGAHAFSPAKSRCDVPEPRWRSEFRPQAPPRATSDSCRLEVAPNGGRPYGLGPGHG